MKKILLGILLPILTFVTLIGTGYATWYFDAQTTASETISNNIEVSQYAQVGTWNITNADQTIKLDQSNGTGITLSNEIVAIYNEASLVDNQTATSVDINITVTITISEALKPYLTINTEKPVSGTDKFSGTDAVFTCNTTLKNTLETDDQLIVRLDKEFFKYNYEPTTKDQYDEMVAAAAQKDSIKIEFTAQCKR